MTIAESESPEALANRIQRDSRSKFPNSIPFIVEGADDKRYFTSVTNHPNSCLVTVVGNRQKVLDYFTGLVRLQQSAPQAVLKSIGIIDRDNDDERPTNGNIFISDSRDMESMIFLSTCAEIILRQFLPKSIENGLDPTQLLSGLHRASSAVGALQLANSREDLNRQISVRNLNLVKCFNISSFAFDDTKYWNQISNNGIRSSAMDYYKRNSKDNLAYGHAYEELLIAVAISDKWHEFENQQKAKPVLEKLIDSQFPHVFFASQLRTHIASWESLNDRKILLQ
jgi:Protein of unknown function (DUF4435)